MGDSNRNRGFKVWYRHSGEGEIDEMPSHIQDDEWRRVMGFEDISRAIGPAYISHMYIMLEDVIPSLVMCPQLTHLRLSGIQRNHSLDCMKSLTKLQVLNISDNDLSEGLPDVVTELTTLRELHLWQCKLKNLPQSMKSLTKLQRLNISKNDFSEGLPDVVTDLTTLRKLELWSCQLTDLPQSMKSLRELQVFNVRRNDFSEGLPDVVIELTTLRELDVSRCNLKDLPQSLNLLSRLVELNISSNNFTILPKVIYQLSKLNILRVGYNKKLHTILADILELRKLEKLECSECTSLVTPPYAVCQQGLPAIKKYFKDLSVEGGTELAAVSIAVVGNLMAGKTSLIRSLKVGKRELTFREDNSPLDETTRVFSMESVQLTDSLVKLIDFGGHSVYHLAYQLTVKQQCIPMIVINLQEYDKLSSERGVQEYDKLSSERRVKEATRRLCIDWMSHLYLACPTLGAPLLILTHRDKLSDEQFEVTKHNLLTSAEMIRKELLKEERECSENLSDFCQILHLSNLDKPLFDPADIFVFGKYSTVTTNIQNVKVCLENRCDEFKMVIPRIWERVSLYIDEEAGKPYVRLSDVKSKFHSDKQIEVILRYLHNSGKVLWFENRPTLAAYIFHQIPEITNMIAVLFHHSGDENWEDRIAKFTAFRHNKNQLIEKQMFEEFVDQFRRDGVLNEAVLTYLMKEESKFPKEMAVELLSTFHIIHGPIQQEIGTGYIIPYFSNKYMDREWLSDGDVQLRLDIVFNGLPIPKYVYQLMTVIALNFQTDLTHLQNVASNGVTILHGESSTYLIHDCDNSQVTLQISTPVNLIGPSWRRLLELAQHIVNKTLEVWKASRPVFRFYCSHCLYMRVDNPDTTINPSWFTCAQQHSPHDDHPRSVRTFTGVEPVHCARAESSKRRQLTVLKPLRFPCYELTDEEISKLEKYLSELRESYPLSTTGSYSKQKKLNAAILEMLQWMTQHENEAEINMNVKLDNEERNRKLAKGNLLYPMTVPQGRALIISNHYKNTRIGSEIDYNNIRTMLDKMAFITVGDHKDYTAQEIEDAIVRETRVPDHNSHGMFFLVIMSHGSKGIIGGCGEGDDYIEITKIHNLLSSTHFPAMNGKPKVVIIQSCSGDMADAPVYPQTSSNSRSNARGNVHTVARPPGSIAIPPAECISPDPIALNTVQLHNLSMDDFLTIQASLPGFVAFRNEKSGSRFIRAVLICFYQHTHDFHLKDIAYMVQQVVKHFSSYRSTKYNVKAGQIPSIQCTFSDMKQLYLLQKEG